MFCGHCGIENKGNVCTNCGKEIGTADDKENLVEKLDGTLDKIGSMKVTFKGTAIVIGVIIVLSTIFGGSDEPPNRPLTQNEQSIITKFKKAGDLQIKHNLTKDVSISFQPDSLSNIGDCFVVIKSDTHSNFDITYQISKGKKEAVVARNQRAKGQSFRLKGDSSDKIITFDSNYGGSGKGVSSSSSEFSSLIEILSTSKSIKIDYGQFSGVNITGVYNSNGFASGYRIAQEICK